MNSHSYLLNAICPVCENKIDSFRTYQAKRPIFLRCTDIMPCAYQYGENIQQCEPCECRITDVQFFKLMEEFYKEPHAMVNAETAKKQTKKAIEDKENSLLRKSDEALVTIDKWINELSKAGYDCIAIMGDRCDNDGKVYHLDFDNLLLSYITEQLQGAGFVCKYEGNRQVRGRGDYSCRILTISWQ